MSGAREHWEKVYRSRQSEQQSWFQPRPETSLELIHLAGCGPSARIIDVGGGTSRLVDALCALGYVNLTVLDVSPSALAEAKRRLGVRADQVQWIEADITSASIPQGFDLWHDRAAFHFLTDAADRAGYVRALRGSLQAGGHAIIATFAEDGPTHCSGLPVARYSPSSLLAELGPDFVLAQTRREVHRTPAGREQSFVYSLFRRAARKEGEPRRGSP